MPKYICDNCNNEFPSEQNKSIQCPNCHWSSSVRKLEVNTPTEVPARASTHDDFPINLSTLLHGKTEGVKQITKTGEVKKQKKGYGCLVAVLLIVGFSVVTFGLHLNKGLKTESQPLKQGESQQPQQKEEPQPPQSAAPQQLQQGMPQASPQQEDYSSYKKSDLKAVYFTSKLIKKFSNVRPEGRVLYFLEDGIVFQKVTNGYLLVTALPSEDGDDPLFLETNEELQQGENLYHRQAYFTGDFEYESINGFNQKIYAFKLIPMQYSGNRSLPYNAQYAGEPNFISVGGRVVPNPRKQRQN